MVVMWSAVVAFTILVKWHVMRISWLDAIEPHLFFLSLSPNYFQLSYARNIWIHQHGQFFYILGV